MATYTIKIDKRNKAAKALIEMIKNLSFIEIIEDKPGLSKPHKTPHYNPAFVREVKKSAASKKRYELKDVDEFWESL